MDIKTFGDYTLITFLDEALRIKEERDYLARIETHPENYSRQGFDEKLNHFGTLTMVYKIDKQIDIEEKQKKGKKAQILANYSPKDIIELSKSIYKMKIRNVWHQSEITQKTQRLFAKISIDYLN